MMKNNERLLEALGKLLDNLDNKNSDKKYNSNIAPGKMTWQKIAPKEEEDKEKVFENIRYKWCGKCRGGKGLWTKCEGLHGTNEHDPSKRKS